MCSVGMNWRIEELDKKGKKVVDAHDLKLDAHEPNKELVPEF
ncbi:MAG: hypothetical protein ACOC44_17880 [Promethearchaeia archaeon]